MRSPDQLPRSELVSSGKLRFFCDNCGIEVAREAQTCPRCGKSFGSVRCPACDFSGSLDHFKDCCPVCGYSEEASKKKVPPPRIPLHIRQHEQVTASLPIWVYLVTGLALIGTLIVVFFTIKGAWIY
ncbi:MAG: zinc ribbon domain-containing protein [Treponema sp.]|jgi:predicted RNA-binding Zn-ribbon protein involved in translation (DUF1610 family)|nr:zinc ribbon domain-containing protein [Treponema sp.]